MEYQHLHIFKQELTNELSSILNWWATNAPDDINGGFYGKIDNNNQVTGDAPKGSVLNARILWTFSAAYNHQPGSLYRQMADRAYKYIIDNFIDKSFGGVYWSVDYEGQPLDTKKQVYAMAFTIYGLSEYYRASKNDEARQTAIELFNLLAEKAYDPVKTGYFEAFTQDWQPVDDLRLSAKDANEKKTMNTHLHVLEGFTNLYRIWPDGLLRKHISILLNNFFDYFINKETHHLNLFFDEHWNSKGGLISYGHDIEATWLLLEAAEVIEYSEAIEKIKRLIPIMAQATTAALDDDGGLWYEYEPQDHHLVKEKHWWVQAEAMVGFFNSWQVTGDTKYLNIALKSWGFIKNGIIDKHNGEWFWGIGETGRIMKDEDKAGFWKCPYHNSRACLELIRRIDHGKL
ncbi:AGE family epimerase/isomerase [Mucilaginibacter sp. L3T2-6]|uniref:AGE family epimerase/isomerase n=1 Tax=Mucilaginibacter sp. L3T2-6 TaxID=3062491 RepID=UPI002676F06F|nr:AGE family epimerase/isomerase [Mucilaginibacter sp. L3T2-6]MDO3644341.1 AGE family epimerase/isomerase [Mucilaginibacter sp. L3T2-6]MDV6216792.1 AGE family epimerase/isomerase [Mucilaginibacter sp. L3T2-6]